jgi:WD40 repeat protein
VGVGIDDEGVAFAWSEDGALRELGQAACAALPDSLTWIAIAGEGKEIELHSTELGVSPRRLVLDSVSERALKNMVITHMAFSPEGDKLAVHTSTDRAVRVLEVSTGEELMFHRWTTLIGLSFSERGDSLLLWTGRHPTARILDVHTGKPLDAMTLPKAPVVAAGLDGDSSYVAMGTADGTLHVWTKADGKTYLEQSRGDDAVSALAFRGTGDEAMILVATRSGFLWGVPLHPVMVVREHMPEPFAPWIADREIKLAEPFTYLPDK